MHFFSEDRCYKLLFRNFVRFCLCCKIKVSCISLNEIMAYLEVLFENNVSIHMLANNVSLLFIYLFGVLCRFQHRTGHITTGS